MVTASDALSKVKDKGVALTKKKLTSTAASVNGKLEDKLKGKLQDKLSSSAKSATSATTKLTGGNPLDQFKTSLGKNLSTSAIASGLKAGAGKAISAATDKLTKAKGLDASKLLKSKVAGMMGTKVDAMLEGEAKINSKLAASLVTTGPKDDLVTVDAYDYNPKAIFSKYAGKLTDSGKEIFDQLGSGGGLAKNIAGMLKKGVSGGISLNTDQLKDRLISAAGGKTGIINKLSTGFKDSIAEATGIAPSLLNRADVIINGVARSIDSGDIRSASTLFDLVGSVINDNQIVEFLDIGARTSLISQIYKEAMDLGVPEAIDIVVRKAAENDKSAIYALGATIDVAVINGNIPTVRLMVEKLGRDAVLEKFPLAVRQILSSYQFDRDPTDDNYALMYADLKDIVTQLDANWGRIQRNGVWVNDFSVFTLLSSDARKLFERFGEFAVPVALGQYYPTVALAAKSREFYPEAVFDLG